MKPGIIALVVVLLGGCNAIGKSDFSCSGPTAGVGCLPATDVYEITNNPELHKAVTDALEEAAKSGEKFDAKEVVRNVRATYKPKATVVKNMAVPIDRPLPVLKPAHVIRIWISPWVDQKGDLRMPGLVFTEITARKWSFGETEANGAQILAPVQINRGGSSEGVID